ncbi:hypothetical protein A8W25_10705 [Streptomyces sp. ERV7]|uniref:hypothetical protein n=1 Tax=Streptomyces sp. ERV7 TaxID=1322334 RepID=UPI0007F55221|nr:hypothetical protein [Streptomyces sp. ERV7]OAR25961.1 hypothetical protein A8W25_10705 [Streptomyces sp. ERV7]
MRFRQVTLCAAVAAATALMPVSAATAESDPHGSLTVTPSTIAPGGEVDLRVSVCGGRQAVGTSEAFVSQAQFAPAADGGLFAHARIRSDAQARGYDIWVNCKDSSGQASGRVTVVHGGDHHPDGHHPEHHATPHAPVHAGGGGTARLADQQATEQGPGTRHAVIGLALAAVAAVAVAGRSARRRRRTD